MHDPIRLGIVGFGRITELVHLPILRRIAAYRVDGVYDATERRLELAARRGLPVFSDLESLLRADIDLVLIATPPGSHGEIAEKALRCDKHVLLEKPITVSLCEYLRLRELAEKRKKVITVFYNRRFSPDYLYVSQAVRAGELGEILFVDRRHHMPDTGASFGVRSFDPQWRNKVGSGGGALFDWGIHLIDQLLHLQLGPIARIDSFLHRFPAAAGDAEDYAGARIVLSAGTVLSFEVNCRSGAAVPLWVVGGREGTLVIPQAGRVLIHRQGAPPAAAEIGKGSHVEGGAIYRALLDHLSGRGELAVTAGEIEESMKVLEAIRTQAARRQRR